MIAAILLLSIHTGNAQIIFQTTVDLGGGEQPSDLKQTADGGFIVAGSRYDLVGFKSDAILMKFNAQGVLQWARNYGGAGDDYGRQVCVTSTGDYVMVGSTAPLGSTNADVYVVKTNASGDTLWSRTFGTAGSDDGNSIFEAGNGDYVVVGSLMLNSQRRVGILRISSEGQLLHQAFTADGLACPFFRGVSFGENETGVVYSYSNLLTVVDSVGTYQWQLPFNSNMYSVDAVKDQNGEYTVLALQSGIQSGSMAVYRSSSSGVLSLKGYYSTGNDEMPKRILADASGYLLFGHSSTPGTGTPSSLLAIKIDQAGNVSWANRYNVALNSYQESAAAIKTSDGGYAFVGYHDRTGQFSDYDAYLIKTDASGQSGCGQQLVTATFTASNPNPSSPMSQFINSLSNTGSQGPGFLTDLPPLNTNALCLSTEINTVAPEALVHVSPNPATNSVRITPAAGSGLLNVKLHDAQGRLVLNRDIENESVIDVQSLARGTYNMSLTGGNGGTQVLRLMLQ